MLETTYNRYLSLGFQMIELKEDKKPLKKRQKNAKGRCSRVTEPYKKDKIYGCVPSKNKMIIDVDIKNGKKGLESLEKLETDLMCELVPTIRTGSGGLHIYVTIDRPYRIQQKEYPDIDFISHKANDKLCAPFAVAGDQVIINDDKEYIYTILNDGELYVNEVDGLEDILEVDEFIVDVNEDIISVDDLYEKKTPQQIEQLLSWIDASEYLEWIANASAIKRELGNTKEAFDIFHEWSKSADNYEDRAGCLDKWKNVGEYQGKPRTMATLYMQAIENKTNLILNKINDAKDIDELDKIMNCDKWLEYPRFSDTIIKKDITKLYQSKSNKLGRETSYQTSQKATKKLYGKELLEVEIVDEDEIVDSIMADFVRVASFTRQNYFQISNNARHDQEGAAMMLNQSLTKASQKLGLKKNLTIQQAFQKKLIQYATQHEYNPTTHNRLFTNDQGQTVLNMFDPKTVPETSGYTSEGKKLIAKFINHLKNIIDEDEAETLLDWMAYVAQNPGKKILWVPLIQSIEGAGKSVIGNLLIHHVFGKANAGVVDPIVLTDTNNSWATDKMLKILEEVKLSGHNRYEVLNNLKPLITNPYITRKEKFEVSSEVSNYCNFMAFTNYKDALPVDDEDRRWWIVFSSIDSLSDLEKKISMSRQEYFAPLHELAGPNSAYGSEFKTFLLDRDLSTFNPNFPPESKHKDELKEIERSKLVGIDEIIELIVATYKEEKPKVINVKLLKEASDLAVDDNGLRITPRGMTIKDIRTILQKLGYKSITRKQYPDADWKGVSPMFVHIKTCNIKEAIDIWQKGYDVDFLTDQFEDLDDEL